MDGAGILSQHHSSRAIIFNIFLILNATDITGTQWLPRV